VVELRQYTLHPGKRDVLIDLFDREFIESQEELGMTVIGQFRDVDDADRFVWLRGFHDMASRAQGLAAFYGGPVWKEHRAVANSTMIDSDNVLLLRPARLGSGFPRSAEPRPPRDSTGNGTGLVLATIYALDAPPDCDVVDDFSRRLTASLVDAGGALQALFVTEPSPNNYPTLPVREHENVFAWFAGFPDAAAGLRWSPDVALEKTWADDPGLTGSPQRMRIIPTVRSGLTGASPGCVAS
jgi:hypothetical protein